MSENRLRARLHFDALEQRDCPSFSIPIGGIVSFPAFFDYASISFANGVVTATGTQAADIIKVENYTPVLTQAAFVGDGTHVALDGYLVVTVTDASGNIRTDASGHLLRQYFDPSTVNLIHAEGLGGNDRIIDLTSKATVQLGGEGNDSLSGGGGVDQLFGDNGDDSLVGGAGNDQMFGGAGNDRMLGQAGYDLMQGGAGNDGMFGGDGDDTMLGEAGDDVIFGESGNDSISGGDGFDILLGFGGNDVIHGDAGNDVIAGNAGNDDLYGGAGNDGLEGGTGDDGLFGGSGQDHLYGGGGIDRFLKWDAPGNKTTVHDKKWYESLTVFKGTTTETTFVRQGLTLRFSPADWTQDEIEQIDAGLAFMHHQTGNTRLLKRSDGRDMTWVRDGHYIPYDDTDGVDDANDKIANQLGESFSATNKGDGRIIVNDLTFTNSIPIEVASTAVHELGHNWDEENGHYDEWLALSGWVKTTTPGPDQVLSKDGQWVFDKNAQFAREYGMTNPHEDFSSMFEAYFQLETGRLSWNDIVRLTPKLNFIGLLVSRLST